MTACGSIWAKHYVLETITFSPVGFVLQNLEVLPAQRNVQRCRKLLCITSRHFRIICGEGQQSAARNPPPAGQPKTSIDLRRPLITLV